MKRYDVYCDITLHVLVTVDAENEADARQQVKDLHFERALESEVGEAYSLSDEEDLTIFDVEEEA